MAEVGIHLEDVSIIALQRPLESGNIGSAQTQFTAPFQQEQPVAELPVHQSLHNLCRAVGRTVVNDQDMKLLFQSEHGPDNLLDVLLLVVGGDDNNAVAWVHTMICISERKGRHFFLWSQTFALQF